MARRPKQPLTEQQKRELIKSVTTLANRPSIDDDVPAINATDPAKRRIELAASTYFERMKSAQGIPDAFKNEYGKRFLASVTSPDDETAALSVARLMTAASRLLLSCEREVTTDEVTQIWFLSWHEDEQADDSMECLEEIAASLGLRLSWEFDVANQKPDDRPDPLAEIEAMLNE